MSLVLYSSAAERNKQVIFERLQDILPAHGTILEIGSGSGQHAIYFSQQLADIDWQPSDRVENLQGLNANLASIASPRILPALKLDVLSDPWPEHTYAAVFSANTAHIMCWQAVEAMFAGVSALLCSGAKFCLYGPFNIDGRFTSDSNAGFDEQLRATDEKMGIRDMSDLEFLASDCHMHFDKKIAMPANNFILVFTRL